ncbi:hypothetical protein L1787_02410 [Acuticoccus sp. M5D2P5]|uniref:hypothetical protein n=1 Tax=Acuticoccus kalidii TaxID=2910977 RepID=UPI001F42716B|nr:hypothetical protein [Acuticoccus kalidii]MCF3932268.1 hypothetical protein [Acuticoccus kalidii]
MTIVLTATLLGATPAAATSGFGCYRVNVGPSDPLQFRAGPTSESEVVATYDWNDGPIIALSEGLARGEGVENSLFDVYRAEMRVCVPANLPVGARWCPVTIFDGGSTEAWVKRRFVDYSECP